MPAFTKDTVQKVKKGQATLADLFGIDAKQVAALLITGHTFWQQGELQKAKNIFAGLALLDPVNPYLHAMLGSIHQKQGNYAAAVQQFSWALQNFPGDLQSLTNRAECYLKLGKFQEASNDLKKTITLDPDKKNPATLRASILLVSTHAALQLVKDNGVDAIAELKTQLQQQAGA